MQAFIQYNQPAPSDHCIVCLYSREGLTPTQDCPECGAPSGPRWIYFVPLVGKDELDAARWVPWIVGFQVGAGLLQIGLAFVAQRGGLPPWHTLLQGMMYVAAGLLVAVAHRFRFLGGRRRRPNTLAIGDEELAVIENLRRTQLYRLDKMSDFHTERHIGQAIVFQYEGATVRLDHARFCGHSYPRMQNFHDCLRLAVTDARARATAQGSEDRS